MILNLMIIKILQIPERKELLHDELVEKNEGV